MSVSNFINSWLKDIVILFIFISIVDMIVAKGTMKKYIDFVIGLLVIFVVINPFIKLARWNFDLDNAVMKYMEKSPTASSEKIEEDLDKSVEKIYSSKISSEIRRLIQENSSYSVNKIDMEIEKGEDFGQIKDVKIQVMEKEPPAKNENTSNIRIKKIETITVGGGYKKEIIEGNKENHKHIKQLLYDNLNIDKDLITIFLKDKGD